MDQALIHLTKLLLTKHQFNIPTSELAFQISSHPSFPSLNAVIGVLQHFGVDSMLLRIPPHEDSLEHLEGYFMTQVNQFGDQIVLVGKVKDQYEVVFDQYNTSKVSTETFLQMWTGEVLVVDEEAQIEEEYKPNHRGLLWLQGTAGMLLLTIPFFMGLHQQEYVHYGLALVGLLLGALIVQHDLGIQSKPFNQFCTYVGSKFDCDIVLKSDGALLFGRVKLNNMVMAYFLGQTIAWVLLSILQLDSQLMLFVSIVAVVPTFYSIYYQYNVAKGWCFLCLGIVGVLWLQASLLILSEAFAWHMEIQSVAVICMSFLIALTGWSFVVGSLTGSKENETIRIEYFKFKRNYNLFKIMLGRSAPVGVHVFDREIVFGNLKSETAPMITIVTNPSCGFCKEAHAIISPLLKVSQNNLRICIRFNVFSVKDDSVSVKVALRLLDLYNEHGADQCMSAMDDIYGNMKADHWLKKWRGNTSQEDLDLLVKQKEWCRTYGVHFTPELLINGRSYPKEYQRSDLVHFVEHILEEAEIVMQLP